MKKKKFVFYTYFSLKFILILGIIFTICSLIYMYVYTNNKINDVKSIDVELYDLNASSKIYDTSGKLISELGVEKRDIVQFDDVSPNLIHAVVATEDAKFFKHSGIDLKRIIGASKENFMSKTYSQGASTITQQIVKNTMLSSDKSIDRKIKEAYLAIELEKKYSKEEIIMSYLNTVLFSGRIYGIERASNYFFSKSAENLTLVESAILAGMIQRPNSYNPIEFPTRANERKNLVLELMYNHGYIKESEKITAQGIHVDRVLNVETEESSVIANSFVDYVVTELETKYNINPYTAGLEIYTTIDLDAQMYMDKIMNGEILEFPDDVVQTGIVFLENKSGKIRALGGGRNIGDSPLSFNYSTQAKRQPGSTIKPILDYAPVLEYSKFSTATPILDEELSYNDTKQTPIRNWDLQYKGWMSLRQTLIESRNVPAVKLFREAGIDNATEIASNVGLNIEENLYEAAALGGFTYGFTALDIANAYATFANNGTFVEATSIEKILNRNGEEVALIQKTNRAMSEATAFMINDILHTNMLYGASRVVNIEDGYYAGKTGQSNYSKEITDKYNFPENTTNDSWFVGYSNNFTCAVWLGYPTIQTDKYLNNTEKKLSWHLWNKVMNELSLHDDTPFKMPENVVGVEVEVYGDEVLLPSDQTPQVFRKTEYFIKGSEPTKTSTNWKRIEKPLHFSHSYNLAMEKLDFSFMPVNTRYSNEQLEIMKMVHNLDEEYQQILINLRKDYTEFNKVNSSYKYIPSMFFTNKWIRKIEEYEQTNTIQKSLYKTSDIDVLIHSSIYDYSPLFQSQSKFLKPEVLLADVTLEDYERIIVKLYQYEVNSLLNQNKLSMNNVLSMREIEKYNANIEEEVAPKNYVVDYQVKHYLGEYVYNVFGYKNGKKVLLGSTKNASLSTRISNSEYLQYDFFEVTVDYEKYSGHLSSIPFRIYPTHLIN